MPRFAANISTMFTEYPLIERIKAAADAGFEAVECQFPYEVPASDMMAALEAAGVSLVLINTPPGDFAAGERGLAALPGRESDFETAMEQALDYAEATGCRRLHVMAGRLPADGDHKACLALFEDNLIKAAAMAADRPVDMLLLEPINSRDIQGYLLTLPEQAAAIIEKLDLAKLRLQYDFYHTQIMRGDVAKGLEQFLDIIGHVQIAGVPDRAEPDEGELNGHFLFAELDRQRYGGWVGAEYIPAGRTEDGLGWASRYGIRPKSTQLATGGERV